MNIEERMREIILFTQIQSKILEQKTGIDRDRWNNLRKAKPTAKVRAEEVEALSKEFPRYAYWMVTGETLPEAGQVSPKIEQQVH